MRIALIANPAAGRGRGVTAVAAARAAFPGAPLHLTTCAGDERRLARQALDAGCEAIVAVGGDGTWSNVAGVLVAERADCRLALLAAGTGNDLARNVGAPAHDPVATARLVDAGCQRRIDVGFVDDRCFVNCAGFGFDAAVLAAATERRWPGGPTHYLVNALEQLFVYGGVEVACDGAPPAPHLLVVIANGARFGGSFLIAPGDDVADGALDVIAVADAGPLRRTRLFLAAARGTHLDLPGVTSRQVREIRLGFREPPVYEVDGELCQAGGRDATIRCVPGALRLVTASTGPA